MRPICATILVLLLPAVLFGQATFRGEVSDATNKEPLIGVNIVVQGTSLGASTNIMGDFRVVGIPKQPMNVKVSCIGYEASVLEIDFSKSDDVVMNVMLKPVVIQGEEVIITAQMRGQTAAINNQITSKTAVNVVSADRIKELPDVNAAEAIGRLPGISLRRDGGEANRVVIRGMEPKLNLITVNGVKMPSTSTTDRSVDLSMISSDALEGIEVFKAATPDMDAEAVGGVVNLKIKKAPDESKMQLKLTPGYNQLANSFGDYKLAGEYSNRFFDNAIGIVATGNFERVNRNSESYKGTSSVQGLRDSVTGYVPIVGMDMSISNSIEVRKRGGAGLTIDYAFENGRIWLTNFFSKTSRDPFSMVAKYNAKASDKIEYTLRDQQIDLEGMSNALNGEIQLWDMTMDWGISSYRIVNDNSYDLQILFWQGNPFDRTVLNPNDLKTYVPASRDTLSKIYLHDSFDFPNKMVQKDLTAQYNVKLPWSAGDLLAGSLKAGIKYTQSDRDNSADGHGQQSYYLGGSFITTAQRFYNKPLFLNSSGFIGAQNFIVQPAGSASVVNDKYSLFPVFDRELLRDWNRQQRDSNYFFDRNTLADAYKLQEALTAGYVMAEIKVGDLLTIITGARFEHENNWYQSVWSSAYEQYGRQGLMRDTTTYRTTDHLFPHLHLKFQIMDGLDLRASANKSVARPDYYWIAPWVRYNQQNYEIATGNPSLKETKIDNYNVTVSMYNNVIGLLSVSGFYKDLKDIFYRMDTKAFRPEDYVAIGLSPAMTNPVDWATYENADRALARGFEVEWQTQLAFYPGMPELLRGIVLNANYTRIWSSTYFPHYVLTTTNIGTSRNPILIRNLNNAPRFGPMPGQAEEMANVAIGYDTGPLSARLSYAYQGSSLNTIGYIAEVDTWNKGFSRWDATIKYRMTPWMNLNVNLINLSNTPDESFFGSSEYVTNESYYGMTGSASIEITL